MYFDQLDTYNLQSTLSLAIDKSLNWILEI